ATSRAELARLQAGYNELVAGKARAESALEAERKTSTEKIELLNRAGEDLRNAFKAMASDALKSNNLSFLELAKASLERFQSEAKGDLETRQKAVADMVAPVRESLNKVDFKINKLKRNAARHTAHCESKCNLSSRRRQSCNQKPAIW